MATNNSSQPPKVEIPAAWLLKYARDQGLATDSSTDISSFLDLDMNFFLRREEQAQADGPNLQSFYEGPHKELLTEVESEKLEVSINAAKRLAKALYEESPGADPDWDSLLPSVPGFNGSGYDLYLLTSEGEMAAKSTLTTNVLGKNTASFLSSQDVPFELDHQYGRLQLQEMTGSMASEKLECSKKSLGLIAEAQRDDFSVKKANSIIESAVPELKASHSDDTLLPLDESEARGDGDAREATDKAGPSSQKQKRAFIKNVAPPVKMTSFTCVVSDSILTSVHSTPQLHSGGTMSGNDPSGTDLGSLSGFMETRGVNKVEHRSASSCSVTRPAVNQSADDLPLAGPASALVGARESSPSPSPFESQSSAQASDNPPENLVLFLSSALLDSHVFLIRFLELKSSALKLIYRDPKGRRRDGSQLTFPGPPSSGSNSQRQIPDEADIIITPNTGIMVTTTQALTQAYLPGESASFSSYPAHLRSNGPVRTRIINLSRRYTVLYVLISFADSNFEVDKPTAEAIEGLMTFCHVLTRTTTIIPLFVTSNNAKVANAVLTLARKHVSQLPAIKGHKIDTGYGPDLQLYEVIQEQQTRWELFLRMVGFNPYAARAILDILHTRGPLATKPASKVNIIDNRPSVLCDFLSMTYAEKRAEFEELVGEAILREVQMALDGDLN